MFDRQVALYSIRGARQRIVVSVGR